MKNAFSLLELLITMALISILSLISYPLYTSHIARKHREQAEIILLEMGNRLEEEYVISGSYKHIDSNQLILPSAAQLPFHFDLSNINDHNYLLKAIPTTASHTDNDSTCQTLTLASDGNHCW